jgi:glycosyltransferase involved in cell wall biosynthesis
MNKSTIKKEITREYKNAPHNIMQANELISVVIPAYNAEKYIAQTLACVLQQTYFNIEIIVGNDGSTDSTLEIVKQFQSKDGRIVIDNHENLGISKNVNRLVKMAKGEIIVRIDADDLMTIDRVEKQVHYLKEHPEIDFVSCDAEFLNEKSQAFGYQSFTGFNSIEDNQKALASNELVIAAQSGLTTRKSAFLAVGGYDEDVIYAEDLDLFTRMIENGSSLIIIREPLLKYRLHTNSAVANSKNLLRNQMYVELIQINLRRRRQGLPKIMFEDYAKQVAQEAWWKKLHRKRVAIAFVAFRNAGALIGNKKYIKAVQMLGLSFFCNPMFFLKKTAKHFGNFFKKKR